MMHSQNCNMFTEIRINVEFGSHKTGPRPEVELFYENSLRVWKFYCFDVTIISGKLIPSFSNHAFEIT